MADSTISLLPSISGPLTGTILTVFVEGGTTKKGTVQDISDFVIGNIGFGQVLSVSNSTGGYPILSPNGLVSANIYDTIAQLRYVDGSGNSGLLRVNNAGISLLFSNGATSTAIIGTPTNLIIAHDSLLTLDAPIIGIPSLTPDTLTKIDASGNLVSSAYNDSDFELLSNKGVASGYVPLNSSALIDAMYLPSFVDDVLEFANFASFPVTGQTGKIYLDIATTNQYRWTGTIYLQITNSSAVWGNISGLLSNQTDLQNALDLKVNGALGTTANQIAVTSGVDNEVVSYSSFTWDETNSILKTGSQASIGSYIGVQLLADNSCTIPFSISSLGNGNGYVNFSVSANPTGAPADSFLFHGDGETYLMGVWGTYLTTDDGTDINSLVLGPRLTTLNKSLLIRDTGSIGHVDEAHAKFHAFDEALGVYFKASTGTTNWNLGDSFGFDFGVNSTGDGEIRQRENKGIDFYTNNVKRWNTNNTGNTYFGGGTIATALVQIAPNTTTRASFNIGVGVTPVSGMVEGDINNYGGRLHHRVGGVTQDFAYLSDITGGLSYNNILANNILFNTF